MTAAGRTRVTAEVVVVGLGAFGSATLYQLARRGVRAIGIDRFDPPHNMGSSHGETRITRLAVAEGDAYAPVVRRSHEIWRELEAETAATLMVPTGGLIMAPGGGAARHHGRDDFVERNFRLADRFGIEHERLDAAEIGRRFPQFGLRGDEVGYYEPGAGMLLPEACVSTQLWLAEAHGAIIRRNQIVGSVRQIGGMVQIETSEGTIEADRVILACGPWMAAMLPLAPRPLARVYRQVLHWFTPYDTARFEVGRFPVFIWMHGEREEDYFYGFPTMPGVPEVKTATETYERDVDPDHVDRSVTKGEAAAMHARHVDGRLLGIGPAPARSVTCLYTVTPDSGFIVDTLPEQNRVTVVSACSGHGFKHSAAIGEALAQSLAEGRSSLDLLPLFLGSPPSDSLNGGATAQSLSGPTRMLAVIAAGCRASNCGRHTRRSTSTADPAILAASCMGPSERQSR